MAMHNGCDTYITRYVDIHFTGTEVCCARCPLLETYARKQCRRTGEYILDDRGVGYWCPLAEYPGTIGHISDEFIK